jgi:uncharacterized membrane protein YjjB (DUF3815 family)
MLDMIVSRLKEPSTYAGISALLGAVGYQVAPEWLEAATLIGAAISGVLAIFMAEKKA